MLFTRWTTTQKGEILHCQKFYMIFTIYRSVYCRSFSFVLPTPQGHLGTQTLSSEGIFLAETNFGCYFWPNYSTYKVFTLATDPNGPGEVTDCLQRPTINSVGCRSCLKTWKMHSRVHSNLIFSILNVKIHLTWVKNQCYIVVFSKYTQQWTISEPLVEISLSCGE